MPRSDFLFPFPFLCIPGASQPPDNLDVIFGILLFDLYTRPGCSELGGELRVSIGG